MKKLIIVAVFLFLQCNGIHAGQTNYLSMFSPKLKEFLTNHPQASMSLSNVISEAFSNRTFSVTYFYTDDESIAKAFHYYLNDSEVVIGICENQKAIDECIGLMFELLNSESQPRFQDLCQMAQSGSISKNAFAREVLTVELHATKRIQQLLPKFGLKQHDIDESFYYERFIKCPLKLDDYLVYCQSLRISGSTNLLKHYEEQYELIRSQK